VLDADGMIKLAKASVLLTLAKAAGCHISDTVFKETVVEGKKLLFPDAFTIEEVIQAGPISVHRSIKKKHNSPVVLGKGERTSLDLYYQLNANAIVSDDQKFLKELERREITFLTPATTIFALCKRKKLTQQKAIDALDRLRKLIRPEVYINTKKEVEELK
jgi:predicted nucleic acid-binding protein